MKRRSFLNTLLGAAASLALCQKIGIEKLSIKAPIKSDPVSLEINPAYESAEFELTYIYHPSAILDGAVPIEDVPRFTFDGNTFVKVDKFKKKS